MPALIEGRIQGRQQRSTTWKKIAGLTIRAVAFDFGGVLEIAPDGGKPIRASRGMIATWEARLQLKPGRLRARLRELDERLSRMGKDGWAHGKWPP